jgi:flagellar M-ring protein FliF
MKQGSTLTESQITGIQNLVAKSVSGLTKDNIALTDSLGNDLIGSSTSNNPEFSKITVTREIENDIRKKVTAVLLGPYTADQFKVSVSATVDTDSLVREELTYLPSPDGNNSGVISEESTKSDNSSSTQGDGGVSGTSTNSEVPTYQTGGSTGQSSSSSSESSIKYQVSQTKQQTQKSGAKVEKISIGIAINKSAFDPGERESVTQLVAYAAGVSPEAISVQNFQFYEEESPTGPTEPQGINKLILFGGIGAGVLVLGALVALILLRKRKKEVVEEGIIMARTEGPDEALNAAFGEAAEPQEVIKPITPVMDARREEIKQFAKSNPEIAAQMIKTWLRSDD